MPGVFLLFLAVIVFVFVLPLVAVARSARALREVEILRGEWRLFRLRPEGGSPRHEKIPQDPWPNERTEIRIPRQAPDKPEGEGMSSALPSVTAPAPPPVRHDRPILSPALPSLEKPPFSISTTSPNEPPPVSEKNSASPFLPSGFLKPINLEQFLGVKLFAWLGGLALFLGVVFFVKYAFDQNLIPPAVRTAMGFLTGLGLTVGGLWLHRGRKYEVMSRTLCATGMLVLYGVTFAAHALYKFPFFSAVPTFLLMALITAVSFVLAVRLKALEVAILGMLGGFLAPILCSTGQDNPLALFTSTALLDIGLLAVARKCRWPFLATFAAIGTLLTQFGWMSEFFSAENYATGLKTWIVCAVFLVFPAIFTLAVWRQKPEPASSSPHHGQAALLLLAGAMVAAYGFLTLSSIAFRPGLLFGFVLLIQTMGMAVAWLQPRLSQAAAFTSVVTFFHLLLWTHNWLSPGLLPWALAAYLIFGLAWIAFPLACERWQGGIPEFTPVIPWLPVAIQLLTLLPVRQLDPLPFMVWPFILAVNLLGIVLAARCRRLLPVLASGALTLVNACIWLNHPPPGPVSLSVFLPTLVVFSCVLLAATLWLAEKAEPAEKVLARWLPPLAAGMPSLLLIVAVRNVWLENPSPVFVAALLFSAALLWLSRREQREALAAVALACVLAVEAAWHITSFNAAAPRTPLFWYVGFHLGFVVWPFLIRRQLTGRILPWTVSAVSAIGHYLLVYSVMRRAWPAEVNGLLPLAFSLPPLLGLAMAHRGLTIPGSARISQMAWFGGVALFFITLAVPVQFRREWITLAWALEGAALVWLYRRVPHPGLKFTGLALLTVSFVRMGLNPLIFQYHEITGRPLLNWHLYGYGLTATAQFAAACLLVPPEHRWREIPVRAILHAFGGILLFLLLNVEIADYFTPPGNRFITFEFHGNFARDMVTTIAWGFFALGLMIIGFRWRQPAPRYAGVGLLAVTLLKLFLHDLAQLGTIHRIGAFLAVALTALMASFLYQRFLNTNASTAATAAAPPESPDRNSGEDGKTTNP